MKTTLLIAVISLTFALGVVASIVLSTGMASIDARNTVLAQFLDVVDE